jgi:hypothetical protein
MKKGILLSSLEAKNVALAGLDSQFTWELKRGFSTKKYQK